MFFGLLLVGNLFAKRYPVRQGGYISSTGGWTDNLVVITYPIAFPVAKSTLAFVPAYNSNYLSMSTDVPKISFTIRRSGGGGGAFWLACGW